jgi:hypothetical protein
MNQRVQDVKGAVKFRGVTVQGAQYKGALQHKVGVQ